MQQAIPMARRARIFFRAPPLALLTLILSVDVALAASTAIELPGNRAFPESLSSAKDGTLYVGSFAGGGVFRIPPDGKAEQWIKPGAFGSASIAGVMVDEPANTLWVCSNDSSSSGVTVPGGAPGSVLVGYDLKTGAGKVRVAFPGKHHFCNDIAIGEDGAAYVTDSDTPQILKLPRGGKAFQIWFTDPSLRPAPNGTGLDGIAFGSEGDIFVNTFDAADLYRIEVKGGKAGKLTKLNPSRKLVQTDGLRPLGPGAFLLIEGAGRLDTMTVKGDDAIIATIHDGYVNPTGVTPVGEVAWVSEGQLNLLPDAAKPELKPRLPFKVYAVPLPKFFRLSGKLL